MCKAGADAAVSAVFSAIDDTPADGDTLPTAAFGTLSTESQPARQGRKPNTGESINIAASNRPTFKAGKTFRDAVNWPLHNNQAALPNATFAPGDRTPRALDQLKLPID